MFCEKEASQLGISSPFLPEAHNHPAAHLFRARRHAPFSCRLPCTSTHQAWLLPANVTEHPTPNLLLLLASPDRILGKTLASSWPTVSTMATSSSCFCSCKPQAPPRCQAPPPPTSSAAVAWEASAICSSRSRPQLVVSASDCICPIADLILRCSNTFGAGSRFRSVQKGQRLLYITTSLNPSWLVLWLLPWGLEIEFYWCSWRPTFCSFVQIQRQLGLSPFELLCSSPARDSYYPSPSCSGPAQFLASLFFFWKLLQVC
jgi:hypothetical protein